MTLKESSCMHNSDDAPRCGEFRRLPTRSMAMVRVDHAEPKAAKGLAAALRIPLPEKRCISTGSGLDIAWMAPDELLIMAELEKGDQLLSSVGEALNGIHHLAEDVSAMRAEFEIAGPVRDCLAKGTPTDVSRQAFAVGNFRRSRIGQIQAAFWLADENCGRIICRSSEARYLQNWLALAVAEGNELRFHHPC